MPTRPVHALDDELPFVPQAWVDLHVHSGYSKDAIGSLDAIAAAGRAKGLTGACLTEHDTVRHHDALLDWNQAHPDAEFTFYPGCEVSARGGHVLAIGLSIEIRKGLPLDETMEAILDAGGVPVPAHPVRRGSGQGLDALEMVADRLSAVEVWNAQQLFDRNEQAAAFARDQQIGGTGGSDAHQVHDVGNGYTVLPDPIETLSDLVEQIAAGHTWGLGTRTSVRTLLRQGLRNRVRQVRGQL